MAIKHIEFEKGKRYPFFLCDYRYIRIPKGSSIELSWKSIDNGYTIKQRFSLTKDNSNTFAMNEMIKLTSGNEKPNTHPDDYFVLGMRILSGVHKILITTVNGKYVYDFDPDSIMPYTEKVETGSEIRNIITGLVNKKLDRKDLLSELQSRGPQYVKEFRKMESEASP